MPLSIWSEAASTLLPGILGTRCPQFPYCFPSLSPIVATVSLAHSTLPHSCWEGEALPYLNSCSSRWGVWKPSVCNSRS